MDSAPEVREPTGALERERALLPRMTDVASMGIVG